MGKGNADVATETTSAERENQGTQEKQESDLSRFQILEIHDVVRKQVTAWLAILGLTNIAVLAGMILELYKVSQDGAQEFYDSLADQQATAIDEAVTTMFQTRAEMYETVIDSALASMTAALAESNQYIGQANVLEEQASRYSVRLDNARRRIESTESSATDIQRRIGSVRNVDELAVMELVKAVQESGMDTILDRIGAIEQQLDTFVSLDDTLQIFSKEAGRCLRATDHSRAERDVVVVGCDINGPASEFSLLRR